MGIFTGDVIAETSGIHLKPKRSALNVEYNGKILFARDVVKLQNMNYGIQTIFSKKRQLLLFELS